MSIFIRWARKASCIKYDTSYLKHEHIWTYYFIGQALLKKLFNNANLNTTYHHGIHYNKSENKFEIVLIYSV